SFSSFNVDAGELATFSHSSANIQHIIARVTGVQSTGIYGAMRVRRASRSGLSPTSAALWLINPNGIFIGDGASFDPQSSFIFSTANRLGFDNGDDFYSHETTISSVLSIANPEAFGFLDKQDLPSSVTPRGIGLVVNDVGNTNTPMLLSNMTLVGSSLDPGSAGITILGDIVDAVDPASVFAPQDSTQYQAFSLGLGALAPGGSMSIDIASGNELAATPGSPLSGVLIQNSNMLFSDSGAVQNSAFSVLSDQLIIENSYVDTAPALLPTAFSLRSISSTVIVGSVLQTSTAALVNAGDIRIDTASYRQVGGLVSSRSLDLGVPTGDAGNIIIGGSASLPMTGFSLQQGRIQTASSGSSNAGDIVVRVAGGLSLAGEPGNRAIVASLSNGLGDAGDVVLFGDAIDTTFTGILSRGSNFSGPSLISLQAGTGGMTLQNTSLQGDFNPLGTGASIGLFSDGDITLASSGERTSVITGTGGDLDGGEIFIAATEDLEINGELDIRSGALGSADAAGSGGSIFLGGRNVVLDQPEAAGRASSLSSLTTGSGAGAAIIIEATETLRVSGEHSITSSTVGRGAAGAVVLRAPDISVVSSSSSPTTLSSSSGGVGDAGLVGLAAEDGLALSGVIVSSVGASEGAAGAISATGATINIAASIFSTATVANDVNDVPAKISLEAEDDLQLRNSLVQSSTGGLAPAGEVRLGAGTQLTLENVSVQSASTGNGASGSILLASEGSVDLSGAETELLTNSQGSSDAGDVSVLAGDTLRFGGGGFVQTSAVGSGNAGTILLSADKVRLTQARIEGTSENAGGGDINIFGRDIQLDTDIASGTIVFITASSASSDADGNGGSITLGDPAAPASLVLVRNSGLTASANAGDGGRINVNSDAFLRDARSVFQVTSTAGDEGSLEINSPEQDISAAVTELDVAILDATDLIQDRCAASPAGGSSLVITGQGVIAEADDDYLISPFALTGDNDAETLLQFNGERKATLKFAATDDWRSECNYLLR
ncbi:filamentous hemagglutinin N-terminal domain-containing protein, partial [Pseudohalioglobus lutimaris]|uniref:two-partner secretion domain-containing protein n=1 Tax=Pseudohalioglobus lutimaris TaxID=1737061 RepID=UPI0010558603